MLLAHPREERLDCGVVGDVDWHGDAVPAATIDLLGGVLNGAGQLGVPVASGLAVGDVDRRADLAERQRDAAADPARCAGEHGNDRTRRRLGAARRAHRFLRGLLMRVMQRAFATI